MSKTSNKNRYTQLMEWLPTLSSQRKKRSKQGNSRMGYVKQKRNG
jgi:hypothetical protein